MIFEDLAFLFYERKIKFYYCVRNCEDNYLSENSTFGISAEVYASSTIKSLESFFRMRVDDRFSCTAISLDDFLASPDKAVYIGQLLFGPLDMDNPSEKEVFDLIDSTRNINATVASGKIRSHKLTDAGSLVLHENVELCRLASEFKKVTGINIL